MRPRMTVLACTLAALVAAIAPGIAGAAPHRNHHLTIAAVPDPIVAGEGVLIYGRLGGLDSGDQTIYLYHRVNPQSFFTFVQKTKTNSAGYYEFTRAEGIVMSNRSWFVRGPGGSHSRTVYERVAALVTLSSNQMSATTGQPITFSGSVTPNHRFEPVRLQEQDALSGNGWRTIATTTTNGASNFTVSHRWGIPGDYTLRAVFPGDVRNIRGESDSITVVIQQKENPTFTISSSSPVISEGGSTTVSGTLYEPGSTTMPEGNTQVTLYGKQAGGSMVALANTITGTNGSYSFTVSPVYNTVYQVQTTIGPRRHTADLYEGVQDVVTIVPSSMTSTDGGKVTFTGTVTPNKAGHEIYLQRQASNGDWQNVAMSPITPGSAYSVSYTFGQTGTFQFRTRIYGDPDNVGGASSPVSITVSGAAAVFTLPPAS